MKKTISLLLFLFAFSTAAVAQFDDPDIRKVEKSERAQFERQFANINWTGQGLYNPTTIDRIPTVELRSRLQAKFGEPTQTIDDLIVGGNFRMAQAVQFEYWFIIDDEIPMMILDLDGPFENGLVYVGASRYIDMMPQVKRTLNRMLMNEVSELASFSDYFYSPERDQWYRVEYKDGEFSHETINRPAAFN
ncbi:MAG: hypothetical protein LAT80_08015 [Balneolaceae bacterium]|nr:hypothetical protein [Balneolaceae bacterium]